MNGLPKPQERELLTPEEHKFLVDMIEHHNMALVMSREILSSTKNLEIMFRAHEIILTQINEIAAMQQQIKLSEIQHS